MSRDMRSTARKPTNATAMTIVKSEIGRRNANDTKFIVPPRPAPPRLDDRARLDAGNENYRDISEKCSSYSVQMLSPRGPTASSSEQNLDGEPSWNAGGLQAPTIDEEPHRNQMRSFQVNLLSGLPSLIRT